MIRSMTAFGRAVSCENGKNTTVEIKSVNNRYFDCSIKISRNYSFLEEKVKTYLQQNGISRGKVEVYIGIQLTESDGSEVSLDAFYAQSYINALYRLRDEFNLRDDITVMNVAQNRDIFNVTKRESDDERDWQELLCVIDAALCAFMGMRESEGEKLREDIMQKREKLASLAAQIASMQGNAAEQYRTRLENRLRQVLEQYNAGISADDQRIITECAIFADKTAIDEELVRLGSHFAALDTALKSSEPVGRKIDFLLQEINREVNTIGSKASDTAIVSLVVEMKSELEKIREQIQNIE